MKMQQIGARIRVLREKQGLTQQELADRLQVTRQTVSNYEIGRSQPDLEMLERMTQVLGVEVSVLLGEGPAPVPARVTVRARVEQLRSGERIPWGAIIAYLLMVIPLVWFAWACPWVLYLPKKAVFPMINFLTFFGPTLLIILLIGVDYLLERQGRILRWRLRVVAAALILLFIFGLAAYQEGINHAKKECHDTQTRIAVNNCGKADDAPVRLEAWLQEQAKK